MTRSSRPEADSLNAAYGIKDHVIFESGQGGLTRLVVQTPLAEAHLYLHGAHLTHWQPTGHQPILFLSDQSEFQAGQPIRGGVPICFPWFAKPENQPGVPAFPAQHGLVRTRAWQVRQVYLDDAGEVVIEMMTGSDEQTMKDWPFAFELCYILRIGSTLSLSLETRNAGTKPMVITEALHTYFQVSDVEQVYLIGLENHGYYSKVHGCTRVAPDAPLRIEGVTDRVYCDARGACLLHDAGMGRTIGIEKTGSATTVVWNPWRENAGQMSDLGDDAWRSMLCIETANAFKNQIHIAPGGRHDMAVQLSVASAGDSVG